ncbi:GIY-YIG nuclease family protein [Agrobacterium salinitolerans]|uniref:GIY-YIG nuclease family protein n=1 Tax=Agrobacterium salinitolerans TaxID=1183413 RepID=A0A9X3QYW8_9HYPH|nr:GIY-YIG nuclease family protein [Agrobacterium salinitolerans]MCZ7936654.1 GIY-YIG nuclease family protein [Agrobacterium salinitolerans]
MHEKFRILVERLHEKYEVLTQSEPLSAKQLPPKERGAGVYTFSDNGKVIYVGRTNNVKKRFAQHTGDGAKHNQAALAFKFARQILNIPKPTYKPDEYSRANLMLSEKFMETFLTEKRRLRALEFRFVEESDPTRQALLEIYVSEVCDSPNNDFDNH